MTWNESQQMDRDALIHNRFEVLSWLLSRFDEIGIAYVLVGESTDYLIHDLSGDVDIVVRRTDLGKVPSVFQKMHETCGIRLVHVYRHEIGVFGSLLTWQYSGKWNRLGPDICGDYYRNGHLLLKASDLLVNRHRDASTRFWMPTPEMNFAYYLVKKIDKGRISESQMRFLHERLEESSEKTLRGILSRWFLSKQIDDILETVLATDADAFQRNVSAFRRTLKHRTVPGISTRLQDVFRRVRRLFSPCGIVFTLCAPESEQVAFRKAWESQVAPFFRSISILSPFPMGFQGVVKALVSKWHSHAVLIPYVEMTNKAPLVLRFISDKIFMLPPEAPRLADPSFLMDSVMLFLSTRTEKRFGWKPAKGSIPCQEQTR